ncbi:MAG: hypothetical protein EAX87_00370 [Candidatus Thorarchaeota archaeon]|nr:hypothetical protein [Candidatus Thorarchaeota archaeon]
MAQGSNGEYIVHFLSEKLKGEKDDTLIEGFVLKTELLLQFFNFLQNNVEPLPEPLRTIFFDSLLLCAIIIPILACAISMIQYRRTKKRVQDLGSSWEEVDGQIPKTEDVWLDNLQGCGLILLIVSAVIFVILFVIFGEIVRDVTVVILFSFAILFIMVICPIMMIWAVRVESRRNAERIKLAEEKRTKQETGDNTEFM